MNKRLGQSVFGLYRYTSSKTDCPSLFIVVVCMKNVYKNVNKYIE